MTERPRNRRRGGAEPRPVAASTAASGTVAWLARAEASLRSGDHRDVREICERLLQTDAKTSAAWHLLGAVAQKEQRLPEAEELVTRAIALSPSNPYYRNTLGIVRRTRGDFDGAALAYREALRLEPNLHVARKGLGICLRAQGDLASSKSCLGQFLRAKPDDVDALCELAITERAAGELEPAVRHARAALLIQPGNKRARGVLAKSLLLAGDFANGWPHYLGSLTTAPLPAPNRRGSVFAGKRVVIYGCEGAGDEIMAAGCIPQLVEQAEDCVLYTDARLVPLFQRSFMSLRCHPMDKEGTTVHVGTPVAQELRLLSSMIYAYFRPAEDSAPAQRGYLKPDPGRLSEWRRRYEALGPGLKVGLSWRAGVDSESRLQRSIPLPCWSSVLGTSGAHFVNLQYGDAGMELEAVREKTGVTVHHWVDANPLADLDDFAAQVAALDLVISVDNTTVHMAGGMGVAVWTLLPFAPNWRWGLDGDRSYWYPSMLLIRQRKPGDWQSELAEVRDGLLRMMEASHR